MTTLTSEYQYLGRSNPVRAYGAYYNYYILLYGKSTGNTATGSHMVSIKMRLACEANASFHLWRTDGSVTVEGNTLFSWSNQQIPATYWGDSPSLTEDGITYRRWVDLKEGTVEIDTGSAEKEILIESSWLRRSVDSPPSWLPSNTKALTSVTALLPSLEPATPDEPLPDEPIYTSFTGVRIYADDALAYDARLEEYDLVGLKVTTGLNVGGTAEIILPRDHPAYNYFVGHKTIVTIYRDNVLRFRGRALYTSDNYYGERTVTCEGEMCLLRDAINRPYSYASTPAKIFRALIRAYNEQVEGFKQFAVGSVTIPDEDIKMDSEKAETVLATLNKMLERCGGYIAFTSNEDGTRSIHWMNSLERFSGQEIEFGENLLDFTSTGANTTELATGIVPYGAKDDKTKKYITIESVNGGKDYLLAPDAVAVRGTIMTTVTWSDITTPAALLKKAQEYLESSKVFITSLELTALDLSYLDKKLDSFAVGDTIRVVSIPHGVNEYFQLSQMTEDFLNPASSKIVLGKDIISLTGVDAATDFKTQSAINSSTGQTTGGSVDMTGYVKQDDLADYVDLSGYATKTALDAEVSARAGVINKVSGTVHISGGAPINMLGGKIDISGSEINFGKEIRFLNESGIRIANKDGTSYYVLRVDASNNCFVGNDYTNLYLRGKDAVYLHKTGAVVTSDRREKNSVEGLPEAYVAMLDKLTPVRFRYNGRGDRYHVGFVAQDVEQAMAEAGLTAEDFGGFVDLNGDGSALGLAYDEFIGLLLHKIKRLEDRINQMEVKA